MTNFYVKNVYKPVGSTANITKCEKETEIEYIVNSFLQLLNIISLIYIDMY